MNNKGQKDVNKKNNKIWNACARKKNKKDSRLILAILITLFFFSTLILALCLEVIHRGNYFEKVAERLVPSIMIILGYYFLGQKSLESPLK